ncbi:major facilitator superfamily transporter [Colletotrichum salicis]|uniref:Major facilitator superfamily transporter n=1 Tax=Colletotrichum salicis TaxID=1209931 RepID=A0A135UJA7_9PEZI|nr:major facilitator superfamily transporter [Colletotrichum salicis]
MGNAAVLGMREDLSLAGNRFNIALTVFFIPYVLFEIFYMRHELATRMGYLNAIVTLSGAFGGLLATGFTRVPTLGTLHTWRHILFFEVLTSTIVSLATFLLPNSIASCDFLTEEERAYASSRLLEEARSMASEKMGRTTFQRALLHVPTHMVSVGLICSTCSMGSLQLLSPTLLRNMGFSGQAAQLMSVPPYVFGAVICVTTATLSNKFHRRGVFFMGLLVPMILAGFALNRFVDGMAGHYVGLFLAVAGAFTSSPLLLSWAVDNTSGAAAKGVAAAYVIGFGDCGQLLSTWTYRITDAPGFTAGHTINMVAACLLLIAAAGHTYYAKVENKKRANGLRDHRLQNEAGGLSHTHPLFKFTP